MVFLYLVIAPFLDPVPYALTITKFFLSAVLFSAAYTINRDSKVLWISIVLLFLTLVPLWMNTLGVAGFPTKTITLLLILYLFTLVYSFSLFLFNVRYITWNIICAALVARLMVLLIVLHNCLDCCLPGMFLAVPITAVVRIILMKFDTLKSIGNLLAGQLPEFKASSN